MVKPLAGELIVFIWLVDRRGIKKPLLVLAASRTADGEILPGVLPILTSVWAVIFWKNNSRNAAATSRFVLFCKAFAWLFVRISGICCELWSVKWPLSIFFVKGEQRGKGGQRVLFVLFQTPCPPLPLCSLLTKKEVKEGKKFSFTSFKLLALL